MATEPLTAEGVLIMHEVEFALEDRRCEHYRHAYRPSQHEGSGEWYWILKCGKCSHEGTQLICSKFQALVVSKPDTKVYCSKCYTISLATEVGRWEKR